MILERTVLGFPIRVEIRKLDEGWDVGIFGGCKTHVGAVTLIEPDGTVQSLERTGHKDGLVSSHWAVELATYLNAPVCVHCGIHYDNATAEQVQAIVAACNELLNAVILQMAGE